MKRRLRYIMATAAALEIFAAMAGIGHSAPHRSASPDVILITATDQALVDQMRCQGVPAVAKAVNAMLKNRLIRYTDNENGIYLFSATAPVTFLGLPVRNVSGFEYDGDFNGVPPSRMVGTAPSVFLQIDVVATVAELRNRALKAGLVEAIPDQRQHGFEVSAGGSYLAPKTRVVISSIECELYP